MKVLHMTRGINDVSFEPELIMVITVPLVVDTTDMTIDEEDRLLGEMMRKAVDKYNEGKKNG
jgi:hypothetical protein